MENENKIVILESRIDGLEDTIDELKGIMSDIKESMKKDNAGAFELRCEKDSNLTDVERNKIDNIMRDFDFGKVRRIMEVLDWKWARTLSEGGIPTISDLRAEAKRLLVEAATEHSTISTGGLRAVYMRDDEWDDDPYIGLEFIAVECEGFDEDDE